VGRTPGVKDSTADLYYTDSGPNFANLPAMFCGTQHGHVACRWGKNLTCKAAGLCSFCRIYSWMEQITKAHSAKIIVYRVENRENMSSNDLPV
jgi:hypothetical protein